jgi:hypothetical protein
LNSSVTIIRGDQTKREKGTGNAARMWEMRNTKYYSENLKGKYDMKETDVYGRTVKIFSASWSYSVSSKK